MKKLLGTACLSLALMAPALSAVAESIPEEEWGTVRAFLEDQPEIYAQLQGIMARTLPSNQPELDADYIAAAGMDLMQDPLAPVLGNADGAKTLVKFTDFRCGYCKQVTPEIKALIANNPDLKVIIREFPILGPDSVEAAKFALAVHKVGGSEAYAIAQDALFGSTARMTGYFFEDLAENAGVDPRTVIEMMDSPEIEEHLAKTREHAAALRITGTPALIYGDLVVRGAMDLEAMQGALDHVYKAE